MWHKYSRGLGLAGVSGNTTVGRSSLLWSLVPLASLPLPTDIFPLPLALSAGATTWPEEPQPILICFFICFNLISHESQCFYFLFFFKYFQTLKSEQALTNKLINLRHSFVASKSMNFRMIQKYKTKKIKFEYGKEVYKTILSFLTTLGSFKIQTRCNIKYIYKTSVRILCKLMDTLHYCVVAFSSS